MNLDPLSQQMLGQYELRELLGVGGMGAVYRAYQASLQREVAIKVLPPALAEQPGYTERFNREAKTAAALEHPHIVPIVDYDTAQGTSYIVMRLLTGGALAARLASRPERLPSLGEIAEILSQLASALDYAHSMDVVHRDLKPTNVMFDNQGHAYLVDFGIAKLLGGVTGLTNMGTPLGTPSYMAPEQWRGEEVTPAADIYALGVMTYQLLTGRVPFESDTPYGLMHKHLHEMPTPAPALRTDVPDAVTIVLQRAMAKLPQQRFGTVTSFSQAFERATEGKNGDTTNFLTFRIPARPAKGFATPRQISTTGKPGGFASALELMKRNPLIAGVSSLIVLLIAAAILVLSQASPETPEIVAAAHTVQAFVEMQTATAERLLPTAAIISILDTETPESLVTPSPILVETEAQSLTVILTEVTPTASSIVPEPTRTLSVDEVALATIAVLATEQARLDAEATASVVPLTQAAQATLDAVAVETKVAELQATLTTWTPMATATLAPSSTFTPTATPEATRIASPTMTSTLTATPSPIPSATQPIAGTRVIASGASLSATPTATETPHQTVTPYAASPSVRVSVESANLRSGPGTAYGRVGVAYQNTVLSVIARTQSSDWYLIERDNGARAWIAASIVDLLESSAVISVAATVPPVPQAVSSTSVPSSVVAGGTPAHETVRMDEGTCYAAGTPLRLNNVRVDMGHSLVVRSAPNGGGIAWIAEVYQTVLHATGRAALVYNAEWNYWNQYCEVTLRDGRTGWVEKGFTFPNA